MAGYGATLVVARAAVTREGVMERTRAVLEGSTALAAVGRAETEVAGADAETAAGERRRRGRRRGLRQRWRRRRGRSRVRPSLRPSRAPSKHARRHGAPLLGAHHPDVGVRRRCGPSYQLALRHEQPSRHILLSRSVRARPVVAGAGAAAAPVRPGVRETAGCIRMRPRCLAVHKAAAPTTHE